MIAVVTGGRSYDWGAEDTEVLAGLLGYLSVTDVWHGDATGVDSCASEVASSLGLRVRAFPPQPVLFADDFKRGCIERNREMVGRLREHVHTGGGGVVIAFPGGNGTASTVAAAKRSMLPIVDLRGRA